MGTETTTFATRTLSGEKLEAAVFEAIVRGDSPPIRVADHGSDESRYYATRDPESFDGMHGATEREAILRLFVFEAFGDSIDLP
jgi:hypothetical protein